MSNPLEHFVAKIAARTGALRELVAELNGQRPPEVEHLLSELRDEALRGFVNDASDPSRLAGLIDQISNVLTFDVVTADHLLDRFEAERQMVEDMLRGPFLRTGRKVRAAAQRGGAPSGTKDARNVAMAREFLEKRMSAKTSASGLKTRIGRRHGLGRSASIEAIDSGLRKLSGKPV